MAHASDAHDALLIERQVRIAHDVLRMLETPRGMQQAVEIEVERFPPGGRINLVHWLIPLWRC
jgi:hypothetical protein